MRRRLGTWSVVIGALSCVVLCAAAIASARGSGKVFYLSVHPHQCLITPVKTKMVEVVACTDAAHNAEVYAVGHGGWGHAAPSYAKAYAIARSTCLSAFQRITGHPLRVPYGWTAYWPDPGSETAHYGDRIVCTLRTWPHLAALGSGWHVH